MKQTTEQSNAALGILPANGTGRMGEEKYFTEKEGGKLAECGGDYFPTQPAWQDPKEAPCGGRLELTGTSRWRDQAVATK